MDRILLAGIRSRLRVGCSKEERGRPQDCLVDIELTCDLRKAAISDDLRDSVDYARVFELVQQLARTESYTLLERFAGRLEEELRRASQYESVVIRVKKVKPPLPGELDFAGIEISR